MPTATKTKPAADKPAAVSERVRAAHLAMKREALARWRQWAADAAANGPLPNPVELLANGAVLAIRHPAAALEADATILREIEAAEAAVGLCDRAMTEKLEPWAGDRRKLIAAVEAAEAEAKRLRELLTHIDGGGGLPHWQTTIHQLRVQAKRLFPEYEAELLADLEVE